MGSADVGPKSGSRKKSLPQFLAKAFQPTQGFASGGKNTRAFWLLVIQLFI